jgi:hypothetical protein
MVKRIDDGGRHEHALPHSSDECLACEVNKSIPPGAGVFIGAFLGLVFWVLVFALW